MSVEIWDRTKTEVYKTPLDTFEEGWELLEVAETVPQLESSMVWVDGVMVAFWDRGKRPLDLRQAT